MNKYELEVGVAINTMLVLTNQHIPNTPDEVQGYKASSKTFHEMPAAVKLLEYTLSSAQRT